MNGSDPTTSSAMAGLGRRGVRRCGIHGDVTEGGRCGTCDQIASDRAEAEMDRMAREAELRADYDRGRAEDQGRT